MTIQAKSCPVWVVLPNAMLSVPVGKQLPDVQGLSFSVPLALRRLMARGGGVPYIPTDFDPLEMWMAQQLGWDLRSTEHVAWAMVGVDAQKTPAGSQWWVSPVHIQVASDGVALLPPDALGLSSEDASELWALVDDLLIQNEWHDVGCVDRLNATYGGCSNLARLKRSKYPLPASIASPWALSRRKLSDYLPAGDAMRPWRRLWMQIQMALHDHPVNQRRQTRGLPIVNAFWWWGGGAPWQSSLSSLRVITHCLHPQHATTQVGLDCNHRLAVLLAPWLGHGGFNWRLGDCLVTSKSSDVLETPVWHMVEDFDSSLWFHSNLVFSQFDESFLAPLQWAATHHGVLLLGQAGWRSWIADHGLRWKIWKNKVSLQALVEPLQGLWAEEI
jgi:hypothetical protein